MRIAKMLLQNIEIAYTWRQYCSNALLQYSAHQSAISQDNATILRPLHVTTELQQESSHAQFSLGKVCCGFPKSLAVSLSAWINDPDLNGRSGHSCWAIILLILYLAPQSPMFGALSWQYAIYTLSIDWMKMRSKFHACQKAQWIWQIFVAHLYGSKNSLLQLFLSNKRYRRRGSKACRWSRRDRFESIQGVGRTKGVNEFSKAHHAMGCALNVDGDK